MSNQVHPVGGAGSISEHDLKVFKSENPHIGFNSAGLEAKKLATINVGALAMTVLQGFGLKTPGIDESAMKYGGVNIFIKSFPNPSCMKTVEETCEMYGVDPEKGYSDSQVPALTEKFGLNELERKERRTKWEMFVDQFKDLLVIMLLCAAVIAFAIAIGTGAHWEEYVAPVFIFLIILANALLGVQQEGKADDAVAALDNNTTTTVQGVRDGEFKNLDAAKIFPGDIIVIDTGGVVPADCQIINSSDCAIEEKMFTGEPDAIKKKVTAPSGLANLPAWARSNIAYKGCPVATGNFKGIVTGTGTNTRMGEISKLLNQVEEEITPLQQKLEDLGKILGYCSLSLSCVVFALGLGLDRGGSQISPQPLWLQMLLIAVALTVAAVPEGLPVCTTISLASGMGAMAKKNAIVKKLKSVETLGQASIICSDKTGTLTKGEMTCIAFQTNKNEYQVSGTGYTPVGVISSATDANCTSVNFQQMMVISAICNGSKLFEQGGKWVATGNLTDRALLVLSKKVKDSTFISEFRVLKENPFDSQRKMMSYVIERTTEKNTIFPDPIVALVKGAPDYILKKCKQVDIDGEISPMTPEVTSQWLERVKNYSCQGFRALALCYGRISTDNGEDPERKENPYGPKYVENDLVFIGIVACMDPPREEVPAAIRKAQDAGVKVIMITGDYKETAENIAKQIGIITGLPSGENVIDCGLLRTPGLKEEDKVKLIRDTVVFSRAQPEDKIDIIEVLQSFGGVVAMTGDGVNDSPALKKADIGIAMGITGTEAAKAAAVMVLTDDSFASIVLAIEEGRRIYCNIQKFIFYILSTNVGEVFLILFAVFIGIESPLVPVQILWLNFITDGLPALALALEELEEHVMLITPLNKKSPIIDRTMFVKFWINATWLTLMCELVYIWGLDHFTGKWNGRPDWNNTFDCNAVVNITDAECRKGREDARDDHLDDVQEGTEKAQTMVIYLIVFSELLMAYSCRSAYYSVLKLGIFTNRWMQFSLIGGIALTFFVGLVPGVQSIFGMVFFQGRAWALILLPCFIPPVLNETLKFFQRRFFPVMSDRMRREAKKAAEQKHHAKDVHPITA